MGKKQLSVLIALAMLLTMAAGCFSTASASEYPDYVNPIGQLPIVKEPITLTAFAVSNNAGSDWSYGVNDFTTWLVDQTGISLDITVAASADAKEKLSLMLTSGEYPDIIFRSNLTLSEQQIYGSLGILMPLNDLIDTYAVNAQQMFEQYPLAKTAFTLNDGNMYDLPSVNECYHCAMTQKMWFYTPWMEQLGAEIPTTPDEFYELLKVIRDTDLNGNGKKDEIPLAGSPKGWDTDMQGFLMQPFARTTTYVEDGVVKVPYAEDGWREGLRFLNKLYTEGLMAPESLIQDGPQLKQMGSMPEHVLAFSPGGFHGSFAPGEDYELWQTIAPLVGPDGRQETRYTPYGDYYSSFSITDKCQYPEAAILLADFMLTEEATLRCCQGVLDRDWEYITEDMPSIDGAKARWQTIGADADRPAEASWNQVGPTFRPSSLRLALPVTPNSYMEVSLYEESRDNYTPYLQPADSVFPGTILTYDEDAAAELSMTQSPFEEYVKEMTAKFISGEKNIETDWDAYVAELENAGMSTLLSLYQAAYDQKFAD